MTSGALSFGIDGSLSGSGTTISFSGGSVSAVGASRAVTNAYALAGNIAFEGLNSLTLSGNGTLTANRTITTNPTSGPKLTLGGSVAGAGFGLTKAGPGTLVLSGANTYNAFTSIDAGTLEVSGAGAVGGNVFVGNGGTNGTAAALMLGSTAGGQTISNTIAVNPGNGSNRTIGGANTSGTNTFSGLIQMDGSFGQNRSTNFTAAVGGTVAFTNAISGAGQNVTKTGNGTVRFSGTNTYSGTTTISAGTLLLNGTHAGSVGAYTVQSTGVLGGTGSTSAAVTVQNGATLAPGTSIGALATGDLTLHGSSSYLVDIDATAQTVTAGDRTNVTGAVTLGGGTFPTLSFTFVNGMPGLVHTPTPIVIIANDSSDPVTGEFDGHTPDGNGIASFDNGVLKYTLYYRYDSPSNLSGGNDVAVSFTEVPEPLVAVPLLTAWLFTRRRQPARS